MEFNSGFKGLKKVEKYHIHHEIQNNYIYIFLFLCTYLGFLLFII